jgi:phosphatidate cytidylyltransferase
MKRILTALALIPFIAYVVLWGPLWLFFLILSLVAMICYHEFAGIVAAHGFGKLGPLGYGAGLCLLLAGYEAILVLSLCAAAAMALAMRGEDLATALPRAASLILGIVYIFGSWHFAVPLRGESPYWLMFTLALSWIGDIAAYYVGRSLGRHPLAPRVSPKKTWEGSVASVAASVVFGWLFVRSLLPGVPVWHAMVLAAAANAAGQVGDLAESAMKRGAGIKDSGTLLPGHGGLLDRVDSTLFALPVVYLYLRSFGSHPI